MNRWGLQSWEVDALIAWMLYHLTPDLRSDLMARMPHVYNALVRESHPDGVMRTVHKDGRVYLPMVRP